MRQLKREVKIGNVTIGGQNPIAVQTMLNVPVEDIEGNVAQAKRCEAAGCQILRVTCPSPADAKCIEAVKNAVSIPIVADIHFDYKAALACAEVHPGGFGVGLGLDGLDIEFGQLITLLCPLGGQIAVFDLRQLHIYQPFFFSSSRRSSRSQTPSMY